MEGSIRIAGTVGESIVDGPGFRYTLFTQGCPHGCPGCHNPQTHRFDGGYEADTQEIIAQMGLNPLVRGVTLSGGEPFCQPAPLAELARLVHEAGGDVFCYTGYTYEQLLAMDDPAVASLLDEVDVLIDGPFLLAERDLTLLFRGSANQRLLDVPRSRAEGRPGWWEG